MKNCVLGIATVQNSSLSISVPSICIQQFLMISKVCSFHKSSIQGLGNSVGSSGKQTLSNCLCLLLQINHFSVSTSSRLISSMISGKFVYSIAYIYLFFYCADNRKLRRPALCPELWGKLSVPLSSFWRSRLALSSYFGRGFIIYTKQNFNSSFFENFIS